jgi:hypothetical protein
MAAELPYHRLKIGWLLGVLLAFGLFAVVAWYSARMTNDYPDYDQDRAAQRKVTLETVRKAEDKLLHPVDDQGKPTAVWVDQDKGLIQIPIDEAMTHELTDLKNLPAASGCEIPGAAPASAPPPPAPAATNAAPAAPAKPGATDKKPKPKANKPSPAAPNSATPPANKETT